MTDSGVSQGRQDALSVHELQFAYPGHGPAIRNFSLRLPFGSRCLLAGANGSGKTTLLQVLAGQYMVPRDAVRVLSGSPFFDTKLTCSGKLSYLGTAWRRNVAYAGRDVPLQGDVGAGDMIFGVEGVDPQRRQDLIDLLEIDLAWRMHQVSDGERRRVQICLGLLKPYQVLFLDEITVDLDIVGRLDLLDFFKKECEERGATIVYATHIFDGIENWMTHLAYVEDGKLVQFGRVSDVLGAEAKLSVAVQAWMRQWRDTTREKGLREPCRQQTAPLMPSRHMAFFR
eukprot:evm.model.scf_504EXC.2 EVM.evm.TU.scf_504EXC.2   scf_504EXC:12450-14521(-)